ncbi:MULTISPECIES: DUF2490 domain-containing protein [unclassified Arcicella]|uniref:DUF2490 domain-containing protein n=1 Tax=unclassified Arcicella TaxID=2644986 RepID=UPI00285745D7|nr:MULTISPECIES: DUF2490 domain-containing protein [unclassified Arcicella]MDR6563645.1 hypothetical protein [Arcicella sp. BE51]MDR6814217.1 hypothetical protein [Arcicella sp. BE140]MDR6825544.1 hypothetical protein [Arcicella sp. BE139]
MKNFLLSAILLLTMLNTSFSQSPRQYYHISNGWTDINISGKIAGKFTWQLENQHRREDMQGDYNAATTTGNPYNNLNQHVFRPWVHYQFNPNVRFSLMPLGWIGSNRFAEGAPSAFFSEIRVSPQVMLTQNLGRVRIDHRLRYEFRWFGKNQAVNDKSFIYGGDFSTTTYKERFRYQIKVTVPINHAKMDDKTLYAQTYNELFINTGEQVGNTNLLDQNRVLIGLGYKFNKFLAIEAGYMQQTIFKFNNSAKNNVDVNNILQLNLAVSNFEQLFKK